MAKYSENYDVVFNLYTDKRLSKYVTIRNELEEWLVNEKENRPNQLTVDEITKRLAILFDADPRVSGAINYINICSFHLNQQSVNDIIQVINKYQNQLSLSSFHHIKKLKTYVYETTQRIEKQMSDTYSEKTYSELLKDFNTKDFINPFSSNLELLESRINEFKYSLRNDESETKHHIDEILNSMLNNLYGLLGNQYRFNRLYKKYMEVDEEERQKYVGFEKGLIDDLNKFESLTNSVNQ